MKTSLMRAFLIVISLLPFTIKAQINTYKNVNALIKKSETDSVAKIERLAALEFHKLINNYRKSKGLSNMSWDETLWVTTQNHNAWMAEANILSHHQTKKNKYYTGNSPEDRFDYAAGGNSPNNWSGENVLYNFSAFGDNIKEIAQNIASRSFEQWKNSPGHNKNMLGKYHATHGVAFKIYGDRVWGTDLFASSNNGYSDEDYKILYANKKTKKKKVRFSTFKTKRRLQTEIVNGLDVRIKKSKNSEAKKKAYRLLTKRFKQKDGVLYSKHTSSKDKAILKFISKRKSTYALVLEKKLSDFNVPEMTNQIIDLIKEHQPISKRNKIDLSIALRKRKDKIRLTLVSIVYPKSKHYSF